MQILAVKWQMMQVVAAKLCGGSVFAGQCFPCGSRTFLSLIFWINITEIKKE